MTSLHLSRILYHPKYQLIIDNTNIFSYNNIIKQVNVYSLSIVRWGCTCMTIDMNHTG